MIKTAENIARNLWTKILRRSTRRYEDNGIKIYTVWEPSQNFTLRLNGTQMKLRHIRRRSKRSCFEKRKRASYSEWFILIFHVKIFEFRSRSIFTLQPLTANNVWISYEISFLFFDENFCVSSLVNITH